MVTDRHIHRQTDKPTPVKTYSLAFAGESYKFFLKDKNGVKCMEQLCYILWYSIPDTWTDHAAWLHTVVLHTWYMDRPCRLATYCGPYLVHGQTTPHGYILWSIPGTWTDHSAWLHTVVHTWYMDRPRRLATCLTSVNAWWSRPRWGMSRIRARASSSREFTSSRRYPRITCSTYRFRVQTDRKSTSSGNIQQALMAW